MVEQHTTEDSGVVLAALSKYDKVFSLILVAGDAALSCAPDGY